MSGKVTGDVRREILRRVRAGQSYRSVAVEVGLSAVTVRAVALAAVVRSTAKAIRTPGTQRWARGAS